MRWVMIIWSLGVHAISGYAQGSSFKVEANKEAILIGEQVTLDLEIRASASDTISFPSFGDTLTKNLEILKISEIDTSFEGDNLQQRVVRQKLTLTSFDSGYFAVSPLVAEVNGYPVESNAFLISVQTVPIDTSKGIYDIRGVAQVPFSWSEWLKENWIWVAVAVFLMLSIIGLIIWIRKKPDIVQEKPIVPARPAHEIALERLRVLEERKLWQSEHVKEYYSELTNILREYIELRFMIPALEQTTDEIIISMKRRTEFDEGTVQKTKNILFLADLVKFAKEKPVGSENEMNLREVRSFIEETKVRQETRKTDHA